MTYRDPARRREVDRIRYARLALATLLAPDIPRKADCPSCVALRDADRHGRWPVGDCSPWCKRRAARRKARSIGRV